MYGGLWILGFAYVFPQLLGIKEDFLVSRGFLTSGLSDLFWMIFEYEGGLVNHQAEMTRRRQKVPSSANLMKLVFLLMTPLKAAGSKVFISSRYLDKSEGLMWTALLKPPYLNKASWSLRAHCRRRQDPSPNATTPLSSWKRSCVKQTSLNRWEIPST